MASESLASFLDALSSPTRVVKKISIPTEFPFISEALSWALDLAQKDSRLVSTAMRSAFQDGPQDDQMIYASRGQSTEKVRAALIRGVENLAPVQLQVNFIDRKFAPIETFLNTHIAPHLRDIHALGASIGSTLWITGPGHRYNAHCDLGDHCLLQIHGQKKIKLWGPSENFDADQIFNFDFRGDPRRFSGPKEEILLNPGEMAYFSKGVMHEISIPDGSASVSISIAVEYLYPILTLFSQALPEAKLQERFAHWDKFRTYLFHPDRYSTHGSTAMPEVLKTSLEGTLADPRVDAKKFSQSMDEWWRHYTKEKQYSPTGILPKPPADKEVLLREWERERLMS